VVVIAWFGGGIVGFEVWVEAEATKREYAFLETPRQGDLVNLERGGWCVVGGMRRLWSEREMVRFAEAKLEKLLR